MPKKSKDEATAAAIVNKDVIQRLNFLYQASVYLNGIHADEQGAKSKRRLDTRDLAKFYIADMKTVGQKTTVKIDPNVKRTICKGCNTTLIPGTTASIRVKKSNSHGNIMVYTCNDCKTSKRIPVPPVPTLQAEAEVLESPNPSQAASSFRSIPTGMDHNYTRLQTGPKGSQATVPTAAPTADDSMQDCSNHTNLDHGVNTLSSSSFFSASSPPPVTTIPAAAPQSERSLASLAPSHNSSVGATTSIPPPQTSHPEQSAPSMQFIHLAPSRGGKKARKSSMGGSHASTRTRPRLPPHFARDAEEGHVVFIGNERLPYPGVEGTGVYIS